MKTSPYTHWIRIGLLCLALFAVTVFLTLPLLVKTISQIVDNPIQPETPAPSTAIASAPVPIPVPTPAEFVQIQPVSTTDTIAEGSIGLALLRGNQWNFVVPGLVFLALLFWMGRQRSSSVHAISKECA